MRWLDEYGLSAADQKPVGIFLKPSNLLSVLRNPP
jgi:hypothetical protein